MVNYLSCLMLHEVILIVVLFVIIYLQQNFKEMIYMPVNVMLTKP